MSNRIEKGNALLQKTLAEILTNDLNDPRLNKEIVSVSKVSLSNDLKHAKVFLSIFGNNDEKQVLDAIQNASGYIKKLLKERLKFRVLPSLYFVIDNSMEYSDKINKILKDIKYSD